MKRKHRIAIGVALAGLFIVPLFFWIGGYDFNERGEIAVLCAFWTLCASVGGAVAALTYPD